MPPNTGICHQVNLEYLARVVYTRDGQAFPDTLVGTDSHTTMVNGLGVLGWGVGGIEAEAAMLGQPISMLLPQVVGFRLTGELPEGSTATDLVLTVTQMLRERGVVGKFVEFFGPGLETLPLADRATIGNMAPEYGATCGIFPVDAETLRYLGLLGPPGRAGRAGRGLLPGAGPVPRRGLGGRRPTRTRSSSTSATSSRAWRARSAPRTASRSPDAARDFERGARRAARRRRGTELGPAEEASAESFPASDPPSPAGEGLPSAPGHQHAGAARRRARARRRDSTTAPW